MPEQRCNESDLKKDIISYLSDDLGWNKVSRNHVVTDLLIIESDLQKYLEQTQKNKCEQIVKDFYDNNCRDFFSAISKAVSDYVYSKYNVAIQMRPSNRAPTNVFKFHDVVFDLYSAWSETIADKNVYSVVDELRIVSPNGTVKRPDISMFVNGILFSPIEVKFRITNQTACEDGIKKIASDIVGAVHHGYIMENNTHIRQKYMRAYTGPVYYLAMDNKSCYVLRGVSDKISHIIPYLSSKNYQEDKAKKFIRNQFFEDVVANKEDGINSDCRRTRQRVLDIYYSKNSVRQEILYNNALKMETTSHYKLLYPRPNQLYGITACLERIKREMDAEREGHNYSLDVLRSKLTSLHFSYGQIESILEKRDVFKNNRSAISLLLQYAAGFGKTYLMCWLALNLRDNQDIDKILMISDRIDLRNQMAGEMRNMNIDRTAFVEATNHSQLSVAMTNPAVRMIIVNIHKFNDDTMDLIKKHVSQDMRYAFLIDEIHRSNGADGVHHRTMLETFNYLPTQEQKRNIIIGLTATPTDEVDLRFGEAEVGPGHSDIIHWKPFDTYTMRQAIKDGFVLDVSKRIVYKSNVMRFAGNAEACINNSEIYENDDRINDNVTKTIMPKLLHTTFKKVGGQGKGMLTCYSIASAQKYFHKIKEKMEEYYREKLGDDEYDRKKGELPQVYIVYTSSQGVPPSHELCGCSEEEAIKKFKNDKIDGRNCGSKNGLMIVVDKLQTGFDVPSLHTLFVDKELHGISAIQTLCRVNRTAKNKSDCLIVDMSHENKNRSNFKKAFDKYSDVVIAENPDVDYIREKVSTAFKILKRDEFIQEYIKVSALKIPNIDKSDTYVNMVSELVSTESGRLHASNILNTIMEYKYYVDMYQDIIELEEKYINPAFVREIKGMAKHIYTELKSDKVTDDNSLECFFEEGGAVDESALRESLGGDTAGGTGNAPTFAFSSGYSVIDRLVEANASADMFEELIRKYKADFERICEIIMTFIQNSPEIKKKNRYNKLSNALKEKIESNVPFGDDAVDVENEFMVIMRIYIKFMMINDSELSNFFERNIMYDGSVIYDFVKYYSEHIGDI